MPITDLSIPPSLAGAQLSVDLPALTENWQALKQRSGLGRCGAAVKGDAYGLGIAPVAKTLWAAGCRDYFVARPTEGAELRALLPNADIYILDGLFDHQAEFYARHRLVPGLISLDEARQWAAFGRIYGHKLPCAIHVDTGINRMGFSAAAFEALMGEQRTLEDLNIRLLMSHLACADDPYHPLNASQRDRFKSLRQCLPGVPASLANSSGIFLGADYAHDLPRPGIALYGGNPTPHLPNPMRPVVKLEATVMQVREVPAGETVGYSATWQAERPSRIAILGAGYKDGVPRTLSSKPASFCPADEAQVFFAGRRCAIVGRISMDMMAIDVTDVPEAQRGARAELMGPNIDIEEVARWAGTISYELLTRLGPRYARSYTSSNKGQAL